MNVVAPEAVAGDRAGPGQPGLEPNRGSGREGLRILSVCSGSGMLDLGVEVAVPGSRVVGYCERQSSAAALLVARMEESSLACAPVWCGDYAEVDWSAWAGSVDILVAGIPCQGWSVAGKQRGLEDERWIWPDMVERIVEPVAPDFVFIENVIGLDIEATLRPLAALGFHAEWGTLRASDVGATHERRRVFILAYRHGARLERLGGSGLLHRLGQTRGHDPDGRSTTSVAPGVDRRGVAGGSDGEVADNHGRTGRVAEQRIAGRRSDRIRHEGDSDARHTGSEMADSDGSRRDDGRESVRVGSSKDDTVARISGGEVADSDGRRRRERAELGTRPGQPDPERRSARLPEDQRAVGPLANGCSEGREGCGGARGVRAQEPVPDARVDHLFAPGPRDFRRWAEVLAVDPTLEPSLRVDADGVACMVESRTDQLRITGNGVVPLQAAVAFRLLADRISASF